ncbi:hypothetical protein U2G91_15800 [Rhodococcoides fascians]|uniref:hypothetical protein n=1 Tax=Rhodococcoides fascians TaxID=1828 RepID=UPI002ACEFFEF|nr:hypothetical protein [Rhodococcus fascians]WQH26567.1 hypothetical protein U2G91_15800 [Rhodococcus fascians]
MSHLSEYLQAHKGDRSIREIGRECGRRGHDVGESTVIPYFKGSNRGTSDKVLIALADVLNLPVTRLRELAEKPAGESSPWSPPVEANMMNDRQRKAVDELIRAFVKAESETSGSKGGKVVQGRWGDSSVPPPSRDQLDVAADADE